VALAGGLGAVVEDVPQVPAAVGAVDFGARDADLEVGLGPDRAGQRLPIVPGMICDVEILTGSRSVLSYLFKPIEKAFGEAMTER